MVLSFACHFVVSSELPSNSSDHASLQPPGAGAPGAGGGAAVVGDGFGAGADAVAGAPITPPLSAVGDGSVPLGAADDGGLVSPCAGARYERTSSGRMEAFSFSREAQ